MHRLASLLLALFCIPPHPPKKSPLPFPPPPTPLCFPVSYLLPLKGLKDPTQSQEKMMMIVLLPAPPPRLCPHSSEMKGGNNYLHVWCLKSFDIYLVEQVWLTAALGAGLSFAPITVHVKMAETWELPISSTKLYVWSRQFSLAPNAVLHVQANLFWNNWQHECFMCYLWTASQDSL